MSGEEKRGVKRSRSPSPEEASCSFRQPKVVETGGVKRSRSPSPEEASCSFRQSKVMEKGGVKRSRSPSPEEAACSSKLRKVETGGVKRPCSTSTERPSTYYKRQRRRLTPSPCIEDLAPEILEKILGYLSVRDVLSFGETCSRFHQQSQGPWFWKRMCRNMPAHSSPSDWQRLAILKYTQALHVQHYPARGHRRARRYATFRAVVPRKAVGYRRVVPTSDHVLLWDHQGTLFLLKSQITLSSMGALHRRMVSRSAVLCRNVQDFTVYPHGKARRSYVYVLLGNGRGGPPGSNTLRGYHLISRARIFERSLGPEASFTQICTSGPQISRQLLFLNDAGDVYTMSMIEAHMNPQNSHAVHRIIGAPQDPVSITQVHSSQRSTLYLTGEGSAYLEVNSQRACRDFFCNPEVVPLNTPVHLPLNKVVKCSLGQSHLCLVDEQGRVFMQGRNCNGQLGTQDSLDHGQPTQVAVSKRPLDVWCGPNYTLALLQDESGTKEVHGCGLGTRGRLPGQSRGSDVFVRLNVQVPRTARSICATKTCLLIMSSHDITEPI